LGVKRDGGFGGGEVDVGRENAGLVTESALDVVGAGGATHAEDIDGQLQVIFSHAESYCLMCEAGCKGNFFVPLLSQKKKL
jgi:hypothetical protein